MELSVEAKREYLSMLCQVMSPIMCETFINMYKEAQNRSNRHRDKIISIFIVLLEEVENWNNSIITSHTNEYETKCHYFTDLLAAVFVCYVKILSSVRITKEPKKLPIKLPTNSDFVHGCIITASKAFIQHYQIFREENQLKKEQEICRICAESIEKTLNKLIPIQQILRTYIADTSGFNLNDEEPAQEEPTVESESEDELPIPVPEPAPEPEPEPVQEHKTIEVEKPNLFDDAADNFPRATLNERAP